MEYLLDTNEVNFLLNASENVEEQKVHRQNNNYDCTYSKRETLELINSDTFGDKK